MIEIFVRFAFLQFSPIFFWRKLIRLAEPVN